MQGKIEFHGMIFFDDGQKGFAHSQMAKYPLKRALEEKDLDGLGSKARDPRLDYAWYVSLEFDIKDGQVVGGVEKGVFNVLRGELVYKKRRERGHSLHVGTKWWDEKRFWGGVSLTLTYRSFYFEIVFNYF